MIDLAIAVILYTGGGNTQLPICHSGDGGHWTYIAPDAQGYNGHKHHSADIYGLSEEECLARNPAPLAPQTLEKWWAMPEGGTAQNVLWPQVYVADPEAFEAPCGTTITLQGDTYPYTTAQDKARTDALDDDGYLTQGEDYGWAQSWRFHTAVGPDCGPEMIEAPNGPIASEPTCDAAGSVDWENVVPESPHYTWNPAVGTQPGVGVHMFTVTANKGYVFDGEVASISFTVEILPATGDCPTTPPQSPPTQTQTPELAETGANDNAWLFAGGGLLLLVAGASLVTYRKRKEAK